MNGQMEVLNVSKAYLNSEKAFPALHDITFGVDKGEEVDAENQLF